MSEDHQVSLGGSHTQTVAMPDGSHRDVLQYPRGLVTGSVAITCERDGEMYLAVCARPGEDMTMAGGVMRFGYADGTPNPAGTHKSPLDAAKESARQLMGLDLDALDLTITPSADEPLHVRSPGSYSGEYLHDMTQPQPGFGGNTSIPQMDYSYGAHIIVEAGAELPSLGGSDAARGSDDTKATWLNVKNVELVNEDERRLYRYTADDNTNVPSCTEVLNTGGGHLAEILIAKARAIPYRNAGIDGAEGFLKLHSLDKRLGVKLDQMQESGILDEYNTPKTQMGKSITEFYELIGEKLQKQMQPGLGF